MISAWIKKTGGYWSQAVLLAAPLFLFWPALFHGRLLRGGDTETLGFPFNLYIRRSLAAGEWPLWMPDILGGMPGLASSNLSFLYPSELFFHYLGIPLAQHMALDAALHVYLSGAGMLLFLRVLGLSRGSALFGAVAFAWSGSQLSILFAGHVNNVKAIALIPWAFWGLQRGLSSGQLRWYFATGLVLALQILAIGFQIFAYTVPVLMVYSVWWVWSTPGNHGSAKKVAAGLVVMMTAMVLIGAPQLLPSWEYKIFSLRQNFSYHDFISWSFEPKESLGWLVPGFFGWRNPSYWGQWPFSLSSEYFGLAPWILSASALAAAYKRWKHPAWFFMGLALAAFAVGIGKYTPLHQIFYRLPIYSGFRSWTRFLCLLTFSVAVLSAMGWQALSQMPSFSLLTKKNIRKATLGMTGFFLLVALIALVNSQSAVLAGAQKVQPYGVSTAQLAQLASQSSLHALLFTFVLGGLIYFILLFQTRHILLGLALPVLLFIQWFDLRQMHQQYIEYTAPSVFFQKPLIFQKIESLKKVEPWRLAVLPGTWRQNTAMVHGYENLLGYHGLPLAASAGLRIAMAKRQSDWFDLMGVRYLVGKQNLQAPWWQLQGEAQGIRVIKNTHAFRRAFFVEKLVPAVNQSAALALVGDPVFDLRRQAIVENEKEEKFLKGSVLANANLRWKKRSSNRFELTVGKITTPSFLVVTNMWYPGWQARVDGQLVKILRVNGVLQGLWIAPGSEKIEFEFTSPRLTLGLWLALVGILAGIGLCWKERGRLPNENKVQVK